MKTCPFCAEEIQDAAIKCKHCGEFLNGSKPPHHAAEELPWYFRTSSIVIALGCVGPLALPMIWWRPKTSMAVKVGLTIGILVFTWVLYLGTMHSIRVFQEYLKLLDSL